MRFYGVVSCSEMHHQRTMDSPGHPPSPEHFVVVVYRACFIVSLGSLHSLMATESLIPELSWLCALLFLLVMVMLLATCVCFKGNEKPQEYGTAGRLSITRDSPILQFQPRNGGTLSISSRHSDLSSDDGNKRNSWTVKDRALPEIPDSVFTTNQPVLENGIHVGSATVGNEPVKTKSRHKAMAPKPPGSDPSKVFPLNGSALMASEGVSGVTVTITVNDKTQVIGNNATSLELGAKPRIPVADTVPGASNSMVVLKKVEKKEIIDNVSDKASNTVTNLYDIVAENTSDRCSQASSVSPNPVCIKIESIDTRNSVSEEENISTPSASLAVAGAVPSSDIPYMTPPLLHNPSSSFEISEESNNTGGRSEVPYTVISVREPLARVREITLRKQRAVQPNSEDNEDHYAMVPEEEQMYAEIGSGHDSGSSSITYAHIEPRELPPVPPTVESLKSVAHAHSRQASTVSTCSFVSNISSTGEPTSPSALGNTSTSLYSTVEKNNKQRKTIHLAEGVSLVTATAEKRKKVEDLYAKVRKKRVDLTISTTGPDDYSAYQGVHGENVECITPPPSPWASTTPPAPPPIAGRLQAATLSVLLPGGSHHIRRHSADPNLPDIVSETRIFGGNSTRSSLVVTNTNEEPDYERIYNEENNSSDSCYEKIKDENISNGHQSKVVYNSGHQTDTAQSESSYPGYESVKDEDEDSADPGYESVAQTSRQNDPGYEPVGVVGSYDDSDSNSDYTIVKLDEIREPGYEIVKNLARSGSDAADPGYEKIKKVPRTDSDATDPGYERVKNKVVDIADPGYETVQRSDSDTDPCYEIVHQSSLPSKPYDQRNSVNCTDTVIHNSKSTVLFVSGNSQIHSQHSDSHSSHNHINDPNVTFL